MIAPTIGLTSIDQAFAVFAQLRTGIVLNNKFGIGGFYGQTINEFVPKSETFSNIYMDYKVGGGYLEYTVFSNRLLHLTFPLMVGVGEVEMDNQRGAAGLGEANFLHIEPAALLEINLSKFFRLHAGVGYRFIGPINYRNLSQTNLSGLNAQVGLKVGLFGK